MTSELNTFFPVASAASFASGEGRTVFLRGREYALFNLGDGLYAMDNECPHRGGPLGGGVLESGQVHCPLHGWAFDPKTGECGTKLGCTIKTYPVRVEGGEVLLCPSPIPSVQS